MKQFKCILAIARQNIRKWTSDYRVYMMGIILIILTHSYTKEIGLFALQMDMKMAPWTFPFLYTERYFKLLFFFPIVLLFCDAPFIDNNQAYILLRSKRTVWSIGQILYIFFANIIYFVFLMVATVGVNLPHIEFQNDWGKILGTLANTNAIDSMNTPIQISDYIIKYFTPLQAMWFTFLLSCLSGIVLGLVIYACNSISQNKFLGISVASALIVLSAAVYKKPNLQWFSPISWSTLNNIDVGHTTAFPTFEYVIIADIIMIVVLIVVSIIANKKQEISVLPSV